MGYLIYLITIQTFLGILLSLNLHSPKKYAYAFNLKEDDLASEKIKMRKLENEDQSNRAGTSDNKREYNWTSKYVVHLYEIINRIPEKPLGVKELTVYALKATKSEYTENGFYLEFNIEPRYLNPELSQMTEIVFEQENERKFPWLQVTKNNHIPAKICVETDTCVETLIQFQMEKPYVISDITNILHELRFINKEIMSNLTITLQVDSSWIYSAFPFFVKHSIPKHIYFEHALSEHTHSRQQRSPRRKTLLNKSKKEEESSPCHLIDWEINFKDLGWSDWIIQPTRYDLKLCIGRCYFSENKGLSSSINMSCHAFLRQQYYKLNQEKNPVEAGFVSTGSCVPIRTRPLTILFKESETVLKVEHRDEVIAEDCGCL